MRGQRWAAAMGLLSSLAAPAAPGETRIEWLPWGIAAFEEARRSQRPIIVNVGHEGCTACRMMGAHTFSDARVIELMNRDFVPIQVDSEMQPDIGERYSDWAWPATAFLKPDGTQVFAIRGSRRADDFTALLERVLARHEAGELRTDELAPYGTARTVRDGPLEAIRAQVRRQLDSSFDDARGGWGQAKILEVAEPTLQLFMRAHLYDDVGALARGVKTADGFLKQLDPVWGGMFYASFGSWDQVVREKRLESQAAALQLFAAALYSTDDDEYLAGLRNVHRYLRDWMRSPEGVFYANHKDVGPELSDAFTIDDYYRLGDAERRARGVPTLDAAVYTDVNGRVIQGLVRAFEASGDRKFLQTAIVAANHLVRSRQTPAGWMTQFEANEDLDIESRVHAVTTTGHPYLRAQAHFGLATLALYQATGEERWRDTTREIISGLLGALLDTELGGFFSGPASAVDTIVSRRKPLEDNAAAARLLYWFGVLDKNAELKTLAVSTVRATALPKIVAHEGRVTGSLAVTLELLTAGHVEFSVVGSGAGVADLLAAGRRVYEPRRVLHQELPGRYPEPQHAAMYICNDDQCTVPITDPEDVQAKARGFIPAVMQATESTLP